jgi:ABC-type multidrug transport system fused ATPase/permease subunit
MTHAQLVSFYEQRIISFSTSLSKKQSHINKISIARLLSALAIAVSLYFSFQNTTYLFLLAILVLLFIWLVRVHGKLYDEKVLLENLAKINKAEIEALHADYSFQPQGLEYANPHHPYSHDLDLFGEGSIFQFVNRGNTFFGKQVLAERLMAPLNSASAIKQNQEAIRELSGKIEFRQLLQATGRESKDTKEDREQLRQWLAQKPFFYSRGIFPYLLVLIPVFTIGLIVASFFFPSCKPFAVVLALTQWGMLGFYMKRINVFHDYVSRKKNILNQYAHLLRVIGSEKFTATQLVKISTTTHQAEKKMNELASLVRALDARLNFMTNLVVNSLLMYDMQCVYRLERWKERNAAVMESWLDAISETEMLTGFGTYAFNHADYAYATIQNPLTILADTMAHPLLAEHERVANHFTIGKPQTVLIITGANMAGKSTFLRTLGVNLVLALNGAPVCAKQFICPVIELRTGMRTADSLKDHQSYFYAELNRLKSITEELRQNKPLLILLDEILKGTNSTDKQAGSIALVTQLLHRPCLAIVATHDLVLGELEQQFPEQIKNYHFEPTIENDQLSFDYKLKVGIAEKMNATFLMKKMGIIPA